MRTLCLGCAALSIWQLKGTSTRAAKVPVLHSVHVTFLSKTFLIAANMLVRSLVRASNKPNAENAQG